MEALAIILEEPKKLSLASVPLTQPGDGDIVVDVTYSGISSGTERLLWKGDMPMFPGMGYPLIPGYESVGRIIDAGPLGEDHIGEHVFIPGAKCYGEIKGLFGGAASRIVLPAAKAISISSDLAEKGTLMALAATAYHAIQNIEKPDLIIGHGVLGRLIARLVVASGGQPRVWEINADRRSGNTGYDVVDPAKDLGRKFNSIIDVSGDSNILDLLVAHLSPCGLITLAGFYASRVSFSFPPAFMAEARFRIAAEFRPDDLIAVKQLIGAGRLNLDGLITDIRPYEDAETAYRNAFEDPSVLKMVLDWRHI